MSESIELIHGQNETNLRVRGKFTFQIQAEFRKAMDRLAAEESTRPVVVELGSVEYMDSSALGMLYMLNDRVGKQRTLRIARANPTVLKILKAAYVQEMYDIPQLD